VIERSAEVVAGLTVVVAVAELLAVFGSEVVDETDAVFESGPAAVGVTTIVTVAEAPDASVPTLHVMVVVPLQPVPVTDTNVAPAGSVSVIVTAFAESGPPFVATIV
jgi:hypothetical protein